MGKPNLVSKWPSAAALSALRPSEYTAALIQVLRMRRECVRGARVLEVGCGSGVALGVLGTLGAASLCGIDIEEDAVVSTLALLAELGHDEASEVHRGNMWLPVAGRRFELVVANLPHFPLERADMPGRLPTWSAGGHDGRRLLDPFLAGLADHLAPEGRAFITHNAFVDLERSRTILADAGLQLGIVSTTMVYIPEEKVARMNGAILAAEQGRSIHCYGRYAFAEMHIAEIARPGALG
ncbi:MAG: methyltransferase domain-containing protein [Pseudomonadota bacterium]